MHKSRMPTAPTAGFTGEHTQAGTERRGRRLIAGDWKPAGEHSPP
ncbi:hypothetical protein [Candidatus Thiosymbion oneisti]|nr:hypothetical protein [Candidatus Thiosymbion oneisti]